MRSLRILKTALRWLTFMMCLWKLADTWGRSRSSDRLYFLGLQNHCSWWVQPWNLKSLAPWEKSYDKPRQHIKKQRHYLVNRGSYSQSYGFSVVMYGLSCTINTAERWRTDAFKLWYWRILLSVPWTARRSNQSILKEISPEYSLEGLMLKPKLQYFGRLMWRLIGKDPGAGKDWRQEEKGMTEDEMVGWHYWLDGHEFEQTLEDCEGQGSLACYSLWGHTESDVTELT